MKPQNYHKWSMVKSLKSYCFGIIAEIKLQANFKSDFLCGAALYFPLFITYNAHYSFFLQNIFSFSTQNSIFTTYSTKYTTSLLIYRVHSLHLSYMIHPHVNSIIFLIPLSSNYSTSTQLKKIIKSWTFCSPITLILSTYFSSFFLIWERKTLCRICKGLIFLKC